MSEQENILTPPVLTPPVTLADRFALLTSQQRIMLGAGIAAIIALILSAFLWGQTPDYRVLYSNLSDKDGGTIIDSLQQMNIPYKFADSGGALMIPANQVHEVRLKLAAQGLPKGGTVGFELMENQKFGITQFAEQVNFQRALEGELARSVQTISAVATARVHLAIPKPSVFVKDQEKPTASVILTMHAGRVLDVSQISAIVHLISSSVPDMSAKNVTIVDQDGTLLSALQDTNGTGMDTKQVKYVRQIEQDYIKRVEDILIPLYGVDNVHAQVTANIDFSRTEQTAESYKPNQSPLDSSIRSQQTAETLNGTNLNASGVPGALSNQPPVPATAPIVAPADGTEAASSVRIDSLHKENTTNYEVDRTISHTVLPVGILKRLTVAVVINNKKVTDAKGKVSFKPLTDDEKSQIDLLVKNTVGFDQNRGDSLNVQNVAFSGEKQLEEAVPLWKQPGIIELTIQLFKYLMIAIVMLIIVFKVIKPVFKPLEPFKAEEPEPELAQLDEDGNATGEGLEGEEGIEGADGVSGEDGHAGADDGSGRYTPPIEPYEKNLSIARQIAQQDPKIVASVIKDWVNGNE